VVAAFDIDKRKVGKDVHAAILKSQIVPRYFCPSMPSTTVMVRMGRVLDSISDHMGEYSENRTFIVAKEKEPTKREVIETLKSSEHRS